MDAGKMTFGEPLKHWQQGYWRNHATETVEQALQKTYRRPVEIELNASQQDYVAEVSRHWYRKFGGGVVGNLLHAMAEGCLAVWDECFESWVEHNLVDGAHDHLVGLLKCHPLWINRHGETEMDLVLEEDAMDFEPHVLVWVDFTKLSECRASIRGWAFGFEVKREALLEPDGRYRMRDEDVRDLHSLRSWEIDTIQSRGIRRPGFHVPMARTPRD